MAEIQTPASAGHDLAATGRVAGPTGPPSDARAAIELADVARAFRFRGEVITAVRGIDLAIGEVEFFSMLGPSDCGKTTTMRTIAGFEEPTRGVVWLDGRDVTDVPANKHDVNMVFQSYVLKNGDIVSQAWSGDIFRADLNSRYCTLKLPIPAVGAMLGTDNRCIPLHGQNPAAPYGSKTSSTSRRSGPWWRTTTTTSCPVPAAQDVVLHLCRLGRPQRGGIAQ
jgi:hypothetical protein